jgi:hypothetical protein
MTPLNSHRIKALLVFGLIFIALSITPQTAAASDKDVKEVLKANVHLRVKWDIDSDDTVNKGFLNIGIQGYLRHNKEWSSTEKDMMTIFVPYVSQDMRASYKYSEKVTQKDPPEDCPDLMAEYSGHGTVSLQPLPGAGNLMLHYLGDIVDQAGIGQLAAPQVQSILNNYYEFFLAAKKEEIDGRRRLSYQCAFKKDSKTIPIGAIGIRFLMDKEGLMKGRRTWTTKKEKGTPDFQVKVSNLPPMMEKKPFQPKNVPGPITYELDWTIEESAILELQRKIKGEWKPLTKDLKEVVAGERVELRGSVIPAKKDPGKGKWVIDGNDNQNYIKEFKANKDRGDVIHLEKSDRSNKSVVFFWYKGTSGKVKYAVKVDGKEYEKEAEFKIKNPDYNVTWENSPDSHLGELTGGNPALKNRWPEDNWPPERPTYSDEGLSGTLSGLEYNGILFQCQNTSDIKGKTQWVQIIRDTQKISSFKEDFGESSKEGLDHLYPCAVGDSFYDAPAIPCSNVTKKDYESWWVKNNFDLYLMFMPEGEGNEWVPLKLIKWSWEGKVKRRSLESPWEEVFSIEPHKKQGTEPTQTDADKYPEWEENSANW